ncbi:MAG TPA: glucuronate isomerase [Candidatus Brachybacterium intestinipullorum]|uniref:Uronate isomerase n=2 Tax=Brachybacterium TaxID=43668 RepID=C7MAX8_BRAFD|nr:glucuronate isomerase [Brachybacterium faecium]ACU86865.1 glucuronate isomerase [Brachybacterium faecium DSM 4810]SLN04791.1 Uronate isomerase [Brachybacterium faecium]HJC69555.1 glucuronate isomerase [Candidatus Brachybacterium intestinipullorum]HJG51693.1 glucuronate isomerase [Brachybacterium faecium]
MSNDADAYVPHPDRLLPADPAVRDIARGLYELEKDQPIVSPHGHVDPRLLLDDEPFRDPTSLFITPDHYVNRLLHSRGVDLADLGVGQGPLDESASRAAWHLLAEHWHAYAGTPSRYWMEHEFHEVFGLETVLNPRTADAMYDAIAEKLARPEFRPRALFDQFKITVMATTDDPVDDLAPHAALAADDSFTGRVIPTFRPDKYLEAGRADFRELADALGEAAGIDTGTYDGYHEAMRARRLYFRDHGAVSSDHAHMDPGTARLSDEDARRLYSAARDGAIGADEAVALRRHLLGDQARLAAEDGLVMTLHPAVHRNHSDWVFEKFGPDVGFDIPVAVDYVHHLRPMLNDVGHSPNFRTVLFTIDETVFSREIAPLAGVYPSVYAGAPWWFIDAPDAILRYRRAVSETIGYSRTSGFIDDTRAFCSIPARHDMSRRLDATHLAGLVAEHRMRLQDAEELVATLPDQQPREVFRLDTAGEKN